MFKCFYFIYSASRAKLLEIDFETLFSEYYVLETFKIKEAYPDLSQSVFRKLPEI